MPYPIKTPMISCSRCIVAKRETKVGSFRILQWRYQQIRLGIDVLGWKEKKRKKKKKERNGRQDGPNVRSFPNWVRPTTGVGDKFISHWKVQCVVVVYLPARPWLPRREGNGCGLEEISSSRRNKRIVGRDSTAPAGLLPTASCLSNYKT